MTSEKEATVTEHLAAKQIDRSGLVLMLSPALKSFLRMRLTLLEVSRG